MNPFDLLNIPFGFLMKFLYDLLFNNYALAIFFFALVVKIVLLPLGIQQQKSQIKMAKIKPKEQAIRGKYAGRTDTVTNQKMQSEILDMYKAENYSPMSGCLPLLIQLPILFALYGIIRNPLTYIAKLSADVIGSIKEYIFQPENVERFSEAVKNLGMVTKPESIQEIDIIKIFNNPEWFAQIKSAGLGLAANFKNPDFSFFGELLTKSPSEALATGLSILLLIPVLNFAASFLQTRLTKKINSATMGDQANNTGMKFMEYAMPLLIVWMSYTMYSALGLYWIFQSVLGIAQMLVLAKIYPLPKITEEEYELARQQYGTGKKKKKKKPVIEVEAEDIIDDDENDDDENSNGGSSKGLTEIKSLQNNEIKDEKYISKTIPKGINSNVKNNFQKTGKKYTIKKRKK
ncbi:MAG: YidC/Oxa1 family membrane protein insertase [Oscillospiraceae bacterium]|nr:YidC/Oxa1 family membrane protein insertase [Oscillospiraceae bacterium]